MTPGLPEHARPDGQHRPLPGADYRDGHAGAQPQHGPSPGGRQDLRDVESQLNDVLPKLEALKIQLANLQIRARCRAGRRIVGVHGRRRDQRRQKLMDIVPSSAPLVIDARCPAASMDGLYVGQSTEIRVASMHDRKLPILNGLITKLSADSCPMRRPAPAISQWRSPCRSAKPCS